MKLETCTYDLASRAWSVPELPQLDSSRTLVLAFGAPELFSHPTIFQELRQAYPSSQVIGCSTAGEIAGTEVRDGSLSLAVARFSHTDLDSTAVLVRDASSSFAAGQVLARKLDRPDLRAMLVLSEGLKINGSELVRGVNAIVDESVVITGGLAGDGTRFERTWVCCGNRLQSGVVAAVAFYGSHLIVGHGSRGGWEEFGPERMITRSEGNVLYELDGKPALDLYEQYLGHKAAGLPATGLLFPLSIRASTGDDKHLVRTLLAVDNKARSLVFAGDIPEGYRARMMQADFEQLVGGATRAAEMAREVAPGLDDVGSSSAILDIAISCVGRRLVLGDGINAELEAVAQVLPPGTETTGFYSYGELSPHATGRADLHNQTMTLTVLSESETPQPPRVTVSQTGSQTTSSPEAATAGRPATPSRPRTPPPPSWGRSPTGVRWGDGPALGGPSGDDAPETTLPGLMPPPVPATGPRSLIAQFSGTLPGSTHATDLVRAAHHFEASNPRSPLTTRSIGPAMSGRGTSRPTMSRSTPPVTIRTTPNRAFQALPQSARTTMVRSSGPQPVVRKTSAESVAASTGAPSTMKVLGFTYDLEERAWSAPDLPRLDSNRTLITVFGAPEASDHPEAFEALCRAYPRSHLIGCSSAGEIADGALRDRSLAVTIARFEHTTLNNAAVMVGGASGSLPAGELLGRKLHRDNLRAVLLLSEGLAINGEELVRGIASVVGESVTIVGGLAGDGNQSEKTWVFAGDRLRSGVVAGVGFYGDHLIIGHGSIGADQEDLVSGACQAAERALDDAAEESGGSPQQIGLSLVMSGVPRRSALGDQTADELDALASVLPDAVYTTGFYAYGAISPHAPENASLPDHTMTITVLGESPVARTRPGRSATAPLPSSNPAIEIPGLSGRSAGNRAKSSPPRSLARGRASHGSGNESLDGPTNPFVRSIRPGGGPSAPPGPSDSGSTANSSMNSAASSSLAAPGADEPASNDELTLGGEHATRPTIQLERGAPDIETFAYDIDRASWTVSPLPDLDSPKTLVLAFGASEMIDHRPVFEALRKQYPASHVVGCSTAGEIAGTTVSDGTLSVTVTRFQRSRLASTSVVVGDAAGSFPAGQVLAHKLDGADLRAVLLLAEGMDVSGAELLGGVQSVVDERVVVCGGLAGDGIRFEQTWVLSGGKVQGGLVTAVGFYGHHLQVSCGASGGWSQFGPNRTITRSAGNTVYEFDGEPALEVYSAEIGDHADGLPATGLLFPVAVAPPLTAGHPLTRTVLAVDEAEKSLTFAGEAPQGSQAHLLQADFESLVAGSANAGRMAVARAATRFDGNILGIAVSSVGRRVVLGDRSDAELFALRSEIPGAAAVAGFYAYGAFAPQGDIEQGSSLHNQTMTVTLFSEKAGSLSDHQLAAMVRKPAGNPTPATAPRSTPTAAPASTASVPVAVPTSKSSATRTRSAIVVRDLMPGADINVYKRQVGDVWIMEFNGRLNETFEARKLVGELSGTMVFDLGQVTRVTSFGIREWLRMLHDAEPHIARLFLARCSESVVNQLIMIRSFSGDGHVVSFQAPYLCSSCGESFECLIDCEHDAEAIRTTTPPDVHCPHCGKTGFFDDDARSYLPFARPFTDMPVPQEIRDALAEETRSEVGLSGGVDKLVTDKSTQIRVRGALDKSIKWSRVLDGVEGMVDFDFSSVRELDDHGVELFVAALRSTATEVVQYHITGCPSQLAEHLMDFAPRPPVTILSVYVPGHCAQCDLARHVLVDVQQNREILVQGSQPNVLCKRCNMLLSFADSRALLVRLAKHPDDPAHAPGGRSRRFTAMLVAIAVLFVLAAFVAGYWFTGK